MSASAEKGESLFSPENRKAFTDPLLDGNNVTVNSLGICSALAVTTLLEASVVMGISVTVVIAFSNLIVSLLRRFIPATVRMVVELVVIATMVILVDQVLKAYNYEVSKQLSVFVGLIITNCIVMGRLEAFAMHNRPWPSLLDGLGAGVGYGLVIVIIGFFRELCGAGSLWGYQIIPQAAYEAGYVNNGMMVLAPGAFLMLGLIIWLHRTVNKELVEKD